MAEETKDTTASESDPRTVELQASLKKQTKQHAAQRERADALEKSLAGASERLDERQRTIDQLHADVGQEVMPGDRVILGGITHGVIGVFRADNTFVEVKRGHCPEGVTLIAIEKLH